MKRFIVFLVSLGLVACLVGCGGSGSDDSSYTRSSVISDIASADIYIEPGETYEQRRAFATCYLDSLLNQGYSLKEISDHHTGKKQFALITLDPSGYRIECSDEYR